MIYRVAVDHKRFKAKCHRSRWDKNVLCDAM